MNKALMPKMKASVYLSQASFCCQNTGMNFLANENAPLGVRLIFKVVKGYIETSGFCTDSIVQILSSHLGELSH